MSMSFEIEKVAIIADSKSEKSAVVAALKMAKLHIANAQKSLIASAKKFNKTYKIGSHFADKDGEICKTDSVASVKNGKVKVSIEYIESGHGWCDIETAQLTQPHYIKLLNEWLNERTDISCDLNEVEFGNFRAVCEDMGIHMGAGHIDFLASNEFIILEKMKETFEARNIDFVGNEGNDSDDSDDDDLSWLGQGNCR
jgi:hypothetical protein